MDALKLEIMRIARDRYRLARMNREGAAEVLSTAQQLLNSAVEYHSECQREYDLSATGLLASVGQ